MNVRVRIVIDIAHACLRLKAEITIVYAMLTRRPDSKKKRAGGGGEERVDKGEGANRGASNADTEDLT